MNRERALCHSFTSEIIKLSLTNTKLRENSPSKLSPGFGVNIFFYFAVYTITMGVACPKPLIG